MLSPQPRTKAQVQTCKTFFFFANEEHGRLKQMYNFKRRKKNKLNSSTQGIVLHLFSEIPLLLFSLPPTSPNQFCGVTWTLLPSSPISLLLIVVIFYSPVFAKCCLSCLPICTSSVRTLSVNFLFVTPSCLCQKSVCWIGCCLLPPHLLFSSFPVRGSNQIWYYPHTYTT